MPTYLYKCVKCSKIEEVFHGINDKYNDCCTCGADMKKVFMPVGIAFKGSGFYTNDSRGK